MKKNLFLSIAVTVCVFMFNSCGEVEEVSKYLTVNGTKVELSSATLSDYGTDDDITYREYVLRFKTSGTYPSTYLEFNIYSTSTTRLEEGTYTYQYSPIEEGILSYGEFGYNLVYDNTGVATSGVRIEEESAETFTGTVTVSKKNDNYLFVFDLVASEGDQTYTIEGEFNDVLTSTSY